MTSIAAGTDRYSIRKSVVVGVPVFSAWPAISIQEGLRGWMSKDMEFEPRVGGRVCFHAHDAELTGTIVEFETNRRVSFTWNQTPPGFPSPTRLTFELADEGGSTRIHLVHNGFEDLPEAMRDKLFEAYAKGWDDDDLLIKLKAYLEDGTRRDDAYVGSHAVFGPDGPTSLEVRMRMWMRASRQRVWNAVASQKGMRVWLGRDTDFEPRLGGKFELRGEHRGTPFVFSGTVTEMVEPESLTITWQADWPLDSSLTIRLQEQDGGTLVLMNHHGFERMPKGAHEEFLGFRRGWDGDDLKLLKQLVESGSGVVDHP